MCLVYPPSYRAKLVVYVALLCNEIAAPAGARGSWIIALGLGDKQRLKGACCDLVDCLDEDAGKTGIKLTWGLVSRVLINEGMVRNMDGSNPGPTPTPPSRPKPPLNPKSSSKPSPPSNPRPLAQPKASSNPRPPSTPRPTSSSRPPSTPRPTSNPRPPSTPRPTSSSRPPSTPRPTSNPRPPSTPRPTSSSRPPSTPKPPSNSRPLAHARPPSTPKPPSNPRPPCPRPESTPKLPPNPRPPSKPRPPSIPKRHQDQVDSETCRKMARTASSASAPVAETTAMRPAVSPKPKRLLDTDNLEMGEKEDTCTSKSVPAAARHDVEDNDVEDGEVCI